MDKLPIELLEKIVAYVNLSELAYIRRGRRQGKHRARKNIRSLRMVCRVFARVAAPYLFNECSIRVFPALDRLREFCILAQSDVAQHIRLCTFRADESLINFKADRLNIALMNNAAAAMRNFTSLEHLHIDFVPSPCCRASGKDWIEQRPLLIARMWADLDESSSVLHNLTSLVVHLSAEEFMLYDAQWRTLPRPARNIPPQLRHMSMHVNMLSEARYIPRARYDPVGGHTTYFEYVSETRYEDDDALCQAVCSLLNSFVGLTTLDFALINSELVAPASLSRGLSGLHFPSLVRFALAQAPAYVAALVSFLSRHESTLKHAAFYDIDLRADRDPPPPPPGARYVMESGPWVALCAYTAALPGLKCALSVAATNDWRMPILPAEHVAIAELERELLVRAQEDNMTEVDLREYWTFRLTEIHCSHCDNVWQQYAIAASSS
ncbi:hypothetical protein EXIGLDRAFT_699256 [Exidia glandulosa HHB12029]|uniref:F-box domain-containing protein n=1 Tax=Exidia glandulosa HHB12029 TaxID=1314781 RepID=A0A165MFV9_EXIGL|nr:hypothetical protein EXIGLDRAFT_699256 [Exidia glandulosa HHB12029]